MFKSNINFYQYSIKELKTYYQTNKRMCISIFLLYCFMMYEFMDIIYTSTGSDLIKLVLTIFVIISLTIPIAIGIIDLLFENNIISDIIKLKSE